MAAQADAEVRPQRVEPLALEQQGEGFHAVLAAATGAVLITNDTGRSVLDLCDGGHTAAEITTALAAQHPGVAPAQIAGDVAEFLQSAVAKGVIRC